MAFCGSKWLYIPQIKGRTNVIGALIGKFLVGVGLYRTNVNADISFEWTMRDLLPNLPENGVVVMDNATFHKRLDIQNTIGGVAPK